MDRETTKKVKRIEGQRDALGEQVGELKEELANRTDCDKVVEERDRLVDELRRIGEGRGKYAKQAREAIEDYE
jgi:uncharacterized coiled-coil DUF342 family protein